MRPDKLTRLFLCLIAGSFLLEGCRLPAKISGTDGSMAMRNSPTAPVVTPQASPSPTNIFTPVNTSLAVMTPVPSQSPIPDPLRFTFPTIESGSVSLWRPPLYPAPWEPTPQDHFYFIRPIGANEVNWPLAKYRYGGVFFQNVVHSGVDIPAPKGTPVLATGSGKVVWAGYGLFFLRPEARDPYGLAIAIKHDFGYQGIDLYTIYGHMDDIYSFRGQRVEAGQTIGLVGETGQVTGPHLHFEVRLGENNAYLSRNPELWISPPQGWGVLVARIMNSQGSLLHRQNITVRNETTHQHWSVLTYGKGSVNSDKYYRENMVLGDLPAGDYVVWIEYNSTIYNRKIEIKPGMVSYFKFVGKRGFILGAPPTPEPDFTPPDATAIPTLDK